MAITPKVITIPRNFTPRDYQIPLYNCLTEGYKRGLAVWHRRAGKDKVFVNILARESIKRVGTYFYILPYYKQARAIIWEGMDKTGFRLIEHIPKELWVRKDNQQMTLELANGSFIRFLGSDNIDSIVGTNPVGVIFSEFSLHKPEAWHYLRPILLENEGWALFNGTPRGHNHQWEMDLYARTSDDWFYSKATIDDTHVMTEEQVQEEIDAGLPPALAKQEFYCSYEAALVGAYYGERMEAISSHILPTISWEPNLLVNTAWDLGIDDELVIWLYQKVHSEIRILDCIHDNGHALDYYVRLLNQRPYAYGYHILPHDVEVRELSSGRSRKQTLMDLGLQDIRVNKRIPVEDGINMARNILPRCWFSEDKCSKGIEALKGYRAQYDSKTKTYGAPVHDWMSHYADAFRMMAQHERYQEFATRTLPQRTRDYDYNPLTYGE